MDSQPHKVAIVVCTGGSWETVYGVLRYKPLGLPRRILQIPLNLTYSRLITCVASKLNLSLQHDYFRMTYQFPLSSYNKNKTVVIDIADNEDVEVFMDLVLKSSHGVGLVTLYVVEGGSGCRDQPDAGNNGVKKHVFTYQQLFPEHESSNVAGTSRKRVQVESEDDYDDFTDLFGDYKPLKDPGKDTDGKAAGKNVLSWMSPLPPAPDGKAVVKDVLWWMNPLPPAPAAPAQAPAPTITPGTYKVFNSKEALKSSLKLKCLEEGFKIKITTSTKDRYEVRCVSDACNWRMSATKIQGTVKFQAKNFEVPHKCSLKM